MTTQIQPVLTIDDLDAMPDDGNRYELIEGEMYTSRAPSITHQCALHNLQMGFGAYLSKNPLGFVVPGPGVIFDDFNAVIPDIVFVSNERRVEIALGDRFTAAPDLAIEIVSPGMENERRDSIIKRRLYGRFGVKEYWLVYLASRSLELYELGEEGLELVATFSGDDEITSSLLPGFRLKLADLFRI
jgi:Uma2 family endonuclease